MGKVCEVAGCGRKHMARGMCANHYQAWKVRNGTGGVCGVCGDPSYARSLCHLHYERQRKGREVAAPRQRRHGRGDTEEAQFLSLIRRGDATECWEWLGGKTAAGYGCTTVGWEDSRYAHRAAYALVHGPIPAGAVIRHTCDNPGCCNPAHLLVGSHADNVQDKIMRGRQRTKTTREVVEAIRRDYAAGKSTKRELAARHNLSVPHVASIIRRKIWSHC